MKRKCTCAIAVILLPAVLSCESFASERIDVYRCATADGAVSLQDHPCPDDAREQLRRLRVPSAAPEPSVPEHPAPPAAANGSPPLPNSQPLSPPPAPPPPRWQCIDYDGKTRESDDGVPRARYVPLWVVGRDPRAPAQLFGRVGAELPLPRVRPADGPVLRRVDGPSASPMVYVEETCRRLSVAEACDSYARQRADLERQFFNAQPSGRAELGPRSARLRDILQRHCGH